MEITEKNDFLYEFSFLSKREYLNDKKQSIIPVLIHDKKVLDIDITGFKFQNGNNRDIPVLDPEEPYKIAKKRLDERVNKEIKPIKLILKEKLEKELFRVKNHYFKQIKEKDEEVETCANKIKMLQAKLRHTSYERDINILKRMIKESKERLETLKKKSYYERLKTEEVFHIKDEVEKHVLSIKNVLMNITVFYYPIYHLRVTKKSKNRDKLKVKVNYKEKNKETILKYDPILDKII